MKFGWYPLCLFCLILADCNHDKSLAGNDLVPPPSNLTATPISASQVELSWKDHPDGGSSWQFLASGALNTLSDVAFIDPDFGFAVGRYDLEDPAGAGQFLRSNREFHLELERRGAPHLYHEFNEGRQWANWRRRAAEILLYFFGEK